MQSGELSTSGNFPRRWIILWLIVSAIFCAIIYFILMPFIVMNVPPIQERTLRKLQLSDGYAEVEARLGAPTLREQGRWQYSHPGLWSAVNVFFNEKGNFDGYEIDW